ncbi:MAG: Clp protease adaptor protein [Chthonomonadales bacterium]|nr:Clp protease adaptor protein [Chthonomonadales bacterium]
MARTYICFRWGVNAMSQGQKRGSSIWNAGMKISTPVRSAVGLPGQQEDIADNYTANGSGFLVIVYDNDKNTWDQVVTILQKATGCTLEEAEIETWEVDNLGKSVVHHGSQEECERAAGIIRTIGIRVEVVED